MRPAFLLDAHISPTVAEILSRKGIDAHAIAGTILTSAEDDDLLRLALEEKRLFVTYDTATVPGTAAQFLKDGLDVPGIIYVSSATIPSDDFSALSRALLRLAKRLETKEIDPSGGLFLERA